MGRNFNRESATREFQCAGTFFPTLEDSSPSGLIGERPFVLRNPIAERHTTSAVLLRIIRTGFSAVSLPSSKFRDLLVQTLRVLEAQPGLSQEDAQWLRQFGIRLIAEMDTNKQLALPAEIHESEPRGKLALSAGDKSGS